MRAVVQRVTGAAVSINGRVVGEIGEGVLVYLGIARGDLSADLDWLADKILGLRIFSDPLGQMNLSIQDKGGSVLVISQFTLMGDSRRGRRPSFIDAMSPELAMPMYERFIEVIAGRGVPVRCGEFGADMKVSSVNDGPVTILLDSKKLF